MNEQLKRVVGTFAVVSLAVLSLYLLTLTYGTVKEIERGPATPPSRNVTVNGEGKTTVIPDLAQVNFSVVSEGLTPKQVQDSNTLKINSILSYLKENGVEAKDIKTSGYFLNPTYVYRENEPPRIVGYTLTQTLDVKIRNLDKVGQVISAVVERGVNQTGGINFTVDDMEKVRNEAREKAFAAAREKAEAMARAAGVRLGSVISFSESFNGAPPYPMYDRAYGLGGGGAGPFVPSIEPGSNEIIVNVSITYALK